MKETSYRVPTGHISPVKSPSVARNNLNVVLALLAVYFIWGSTFLGMRIALETIPVFIMSGIRFIVAGAVLYVFLRARHNAAPTRKQWAGAALIGFLLVTCGNGGVGLAEGWHVASGLAAVAVGAMPLWAALFLGLMGRWPSRLEWIGLVLGFVGVILLNLESGMWSSPLAAISLILAPLCWALGSALSSHISLPPGLMASAAQMLLGGIFMLASGLLFGERINSLPSLPSLLALIFLIFIGSLVAFSAYGYLLRNVRPALATSYAYINPLVAVGLGVGMAGEHITLVGLLAMFVILTGVGLVTLGRQR